MLYHPFCVSVLLVLMSGHAVRSQSFASSVTPPPMPRRAIAPPTQPFPGESIEFNDNGIKYTIFIPTDMVIPPTGEVTLTVNFHAAVWFGIQEHLRRGLRGPLICCYAGEGSSVYRRAFEDRDRLRRWLSTTEEALNKRSPTVAHKVTRMDITSFSAGYGAVREIVKSPDYFALLNRVILCDSMYAGHEPNATDKRPQVDQIEVWEPLARAAMRGEKMFVFTHSQVPTPTYASSADCADALLRAVGMNSRSVRRGTCPATLDPEFPLLTRADAGNFHVWGYGGNDAMAHMTHPRHMADVWAAFDDAEAMRGRRWQRTPYGDTLVRPLGSAAYPHKSRAAGFERNGVRYSAAQNYSDSNVAIFIPTGFHLTDAVNYVVHFHGHMSVISHTLDHHELRKQHARSGVNAILVVPQGPRNARDSGGGRIELEAGGLRALLADITRFLHNSGRLRTSTIGKIVISAHSGGYKTTAGALRRGGLTENITDVLLLDASYAELDAFADWVSQAGTDRRLVSLYTDHLAEENAALQRLLADRDSKPVIIAEDKLTERAVTARQAHFMHTKLAHDDVPHKRAYLELLLRSSALPTTESLRPR